MGINGAFRFFADGTNQHSLDIMEIRANGDVSVDSAAKRFSDDGQDQKLNPVDTSANYHAPQIYGKDSAAAQIAIYGALIAPTDSE